MASKPALLQEQFPETLGAHFSLSEDCNLHCPHSKPFYGLQNTANEKKNPFWLAKSIFHITQDIRMEMNRESDSDSDNDDD